MSNHNLTNDDFKLISYKKKRLKPTNEINLETVVEQTSSKYFNLNSAIRRIELAKEDLITSDVYSSILASLREALGILKSSTVKEIVCFGLGKVTECTIARYQVALLICLKDLYDAPTFVYDPVFNENDCAIFEALNLNLLHNNLEGKYRVKTENTIFYLPHCPKQLTNNLLWANWGLQLHYNVIISNSFTQIIEANSKRHIVENAEYILRASPFVTELAVINTFKYYEIFNDTAIHIFPWENLRLACQDLWDSCTEPNYPDNDIEFITNKNQR